MIYILRYARIVLAIYLIVASILLYRKRKHGIDILICMYAINVILFYTEYFYGNLDVPHLNQWSSLLGLHSVVIFAFYCTEKILLLRGLAKAHDLSQEKE